MNEQEEELLNAIFAYVTAKESKASKDVIDEKTDLMNKAMNELIIEYKSLNLGVILQQ